MVEVIVATAVAVRHGPWSRSKSKSMLIVDRVVNIDVGGLPLPRGKGSGRRKTHFVQL